MATPEQIYVNKDGLRRKFEEARIEPTRGGQYGDGGEFITIEFKVLASEISTTPLVLSDVSPLPRNHVVQEIQIVPLGQPAAATTLTLGTRDYDGAVVPNALLAALAISGYKPGSVNRVAAGATGAGTAMGVRTVKPYDLTISGTVTGSVELFIRLHAFVPNKDPNPGNF